MTLTTTDAFRSMGASGVAGSPRMADEQNGGGVARSCGAGGLSGSSCGARLRWKTERWGERVEQQRAEERSEAPSVGIDVERCGVCVRARVQFRVAQERGWCAVRERAPWQPRATLERDKLNKVLIIIA